LILRVIIDRGSKKVEIEAKRLQDEFVTLKAAIEEAIIKGQKSVAGPDDIFGYGLVSEEDLVRTSMNAGSDVVGWVDDF
jgi:hypothetical protein